MIRDDKDDEISFNIHEEVKIFNQQFNHALFDADFKIWLIEKNMTQKDYDDWCDKHDEDSEWDRIVGFLIRLGRYHKLMEL